MTSLSSPDFVKGVAAGVVASAVVGVGLMWLRSKPEAESEDLSTTSSTHGGQVYETNKAVAEYLQFHFGADEDILPYAEGPREALRFASR